MKRHSNRRSTNSLAYLALAALTAALIVAALGVDQKPVTAAGGIGDPIETMYRRSAPNFDLNESLNAAPIRQATGEQLAVLANLKASMNAPDMTARWNDLGGSPDMMSGFASQPMPGTPEEGARAFLSAERVAFRAFGPEYDHPFQPSRSSRRSPSAVSTDVQRRAGGGRRHRCSDEREQSGDHGVGAVL
jgi:hypothetical protein